MTVNYSGIWFITLDPDVKLKAFSIKTHSFCELDHLTARRFFLSMLWKDLAYKKSVNLLNKSYLRVISALQLGEISIQNLEATRQNVQ
jgi:hypothetical protein